MIVCPGCKNTLPDWVTKCQFCQTDVRNVVRTKNDDDVPRYTHKLPEKTIWGIYYALAVFWLINGSYYIVEALPKANKDGSAGAMDFGNYLFLAIGAFTVLVGLGLILKVELVRGIVNVISALNLLFGLFGLLSGLMSLFTMAQLGYIMVAMSLLQIIVSGGTIWIIGETQSRSHV